MYEQDARTSLYRVSARTSWGVALSALAELTYQGTLFEKGVLVHLPDDDPLKPAFERIYEILGSVGPKAAMGAKDLYVLFS